MYQPAVQMYTLRDYMETSQDFAESLAKVSEIGYRAVQLSAVGAMAGDTPTVTPGQARRMLDDNGLKCIGTHRSWESLAQDTTREIDFHQVLGCGYAAIGGLPDNYRVQGASGFTAFLRDSAPVVATLKEAGIRFGYHNHAWEFERAGFQNGLPRTLFDIFLEEGGADFFLEVDLYWAGNGGLNPERLLERCVGRAPVVHLKDCEVVAGGEPVMAPVGEGNLDWTHLLPLCAAMGVEWATVEQDYCRRDPYDCLRSSFEFLRRSEAALF